MFAIVFFWQFPHFFSIAWLYLEDYAAGSIRMLPVVEPDGKSTSRQILLYSIALIPVTLTPTLLGLSGYVYFAGAIALGLALFYFGWRLASAGTADTARSKRPARQLLQATIVYLPLLFALMMINSR
jgi:protoheme IX farnesyltransferase